QRLDVVGEQQGGAAHARGGQRRLRAGVPTTHHDDVKLFRVQHGPPRDLRHFSKHVSRHVFSQHVFSQHVSQRFSQHALQQHSQSNGPICPIFEQPSIVLKSTRQRGSNGQPRCRATASRAQKEPHKPS